MHFTLHIPTYNAARKIDCNDTTPDWYRRERAFGANVPMLHKGMTTFAR